MAQESSLCPEPRRNGLAVRIGNLVQLSQGEGGLLCRAVSCFEVKIYMRSLVGLGLGMEELHQLVCPICWTERSLGHGSLE